MSYQTALSLSGEIDDSCTESSTCPYENEKTRDSKCSSCSAEIANQHLRMIEPLRSNITEAAYELCFPPEIVMAMVSKLSVENGAALWISLETGWR